MPATATTRPRRELLLRDCDLQLDCRNAATVKALAEGLCVAARLTMLECARINFDADPTHNLAIALMSMQQLQVLHMKEVSFQTTSHAIQCAGALLGKPGLKELCFSHVQIPFNSSASLQVRALT